ncbi:hypothetical protein PHYSODRAFT_332559 [Phytophthora sojae]|uniref:Uncharacterized protein n=1 Tax=Phytophthora sojae (strain P6497) TaxID=1094619 RepID=G4ZJF7_PHYSP|nr:hypothetical protein PHYSODRAFT_332559 [Phytophthora sojae]EGZ18822.1 hypothetical protein PHYSODRAFT_332559 [Phytophthora sojae]|eukprot:XP_009527880.1 hypothetical protein PHYSODRAFT_332559 [Phytophthora sojae]
MTRNRGEELEIDVPPLPVSVPVPPERRLMWTGPFAMPPPTSTGGMEYTGADSVSMATASPSRDDVHEERLSLRVTNAPTLPAAPRYSGSTMKAGAEFMHAFQMYVHALSAFDTSYGKLYGADALAGCGDSGRVIDHFHVGAVILSLLFRITMFACVTVVVRIVVVTLVAGVHGLVTTCVGEDPLLSFFEATFELPPAAPSRMRNDSSGSSAASASRSASEAFVDIGCRRGGKLLCERRSRCKPERMSDDPTRG